MRYLICETDWATMSLAKSIEESGTLLTRTDAPGDLRHFLKIGSYDLVIVDSGALRTEMPLGTLSKVCGDTPIAVLATGPASDQIARWLDSGAATVIDLRTPFAAVLANLQAVARRGHGLSSAEIVYDGLTIDLAARCALGPEGELALAPKIYEMLEYIALRPDQLVTRDELLGHIYPIGAEPASRIFDVFLHHLRRALRDAGDSVRIATARGAGFRLVLTGNRGPQVLAA